MTIYELCQGDGYANAEWQGMDPSLFLKLLQVLETSGRCRVFRNDDAANILEWGVKF